MPNLISGFFFFPYLETLRWLRGSDFWKDTDLKMERTQVLSRRRTGPSAHLHTLWLVTALSVLHNKNADFQTAHFLPFCFLSNSHPVTLKLLIIISKSC